MKRKHDGNSKEKKECNNMNNSSYNQPETYAEKKNCIEENAPKKAKRDIGKDLCPIDPSQPLTFNNNKTKQLCNKAKMKKKCSLTKKDLETQESYPAHAFTEVSSCAKEEINPKPDERFENQEIKNSEQENLRSSKQTERNLKTQESYPVLAFTEISSCAKEEMNPKPDERFEDQKITNSKQENLCSSKQSTPYHEDKQNFDESPLAASQDLTDRIGKMIPSANLKRSDILEEETYPMYFFSEGHCSTGTQATLPPQKRIAIPVDKPSQALVKFLRKCDTTFWLKHNSNSLTLMWLAHLIHRMQFLHLIQPDGVFTAEDMLAKFTRDTLTEKRLSTFFKKMDHIILRDFKSLFIKNADLVQRLLSEYPTS